MTYRTTIPNETGITGGIVFDPPARPPDRHRADLITANAILPPNALTIGTLDFSRPANSGWIAYS